MKKLIALFLSFILLCGMLLLGGCGKNEDVAYIVIEGYGILTVELYEDKAPITVKNFKKLVNEGFYDGLTFHRVIENFMIQGGCPLGNGRGSSKDTIEGEFAKNGIDTGLKHERGTISMARQGSELEAYESVPEEYRSYLEKAYNSASCQFFIVHKTSANNTRSLDGKYAAFGKVIDGIEIVDEIASVTKDANNKPVMPVVIRTITLDRAAADAAMQEK